MVTNAVEKNKAGNEGGYYYGGLGFILIQWSGKALFEQRFEIDEEQGNSRQWKQ